MIRATVLMSVLLLSAAPAFASGLSAKQTVERVVVETNENGEVVERRESADRIAPGEEVIYSLEFSNEGDQPAVDLVLTIPVPEYMVYVDNTASGDFGRAVFSADGGETFSDRGDLKITVNGQPRSALSEDITHVRWNVAGPISAGGSGQLEFRAVVR